MPTPIIYAKQLAEVTRRLREQGVLDSDPQLYSKFQNAFQIVLGGAVAQRASQISIDLPDIENDVQADILPDNVNATRALYFAAQLEELKLFAVADKVADQFQTGMIPLTRSAGGEAIYRYIREAINRFTENERRSIYARCFGFAQGSVDEPMPNREFNDLWIRFLSAVSYLRQLQNSMQPQVVTQSQIFKNARDLAVNLSLHGYGIAHFAAVELQDLLKNILKMLSYPDVLQAYGVLDVWQLVERVSALYLGGAVNSVRQRTLASAGSTIIGWLAKKQSILRGATGNLDVGHDEELGQAVERWLAVTGTVEDAVQKYSEPVSIATQPTIPTLSLASIPDALSMLGRQNGAQAALQGVSGLVPNVGKA